MLENDLYDEMIIPTGKIDHENEERSDDPSDKKYSVYISNFSWWTTDQELLDLVASVGVTDLLDIQIHHNPPNGLSKGYATVSVDSQMSLRLLNKLQNKIMNKRKICVSEFTLANMLKHETSFDEMILNKSCCTSECIQSPIKPAVLPYQAGSSSSSLTVLAPPIFRSPMVSPPIACTPIMIPPPPIHHQLLLPSLPHNRMLVAPQTHHQVLHPPPATNTMHICSRLQAPISHLNFMSPTPSPAVITGVPAKQRILCDTSACIPIILPSQTDPPSEICAFPPKEKMLTKEEFEEVFNLNRIIVDRSLDRALQDAQAGHFVKAIETLVTAISLIKESRLGCDSQGIALMRPLQKLLQEIEMDLSKPKIIFLNQNKSTSMSSTSKMEAKKRRRSPSPYSRPRYPERSPRASSDSISNFCYRDKYNKIKERSRSKDIDFDFSKYGKCKEP